MSTQAMTKERRQELVAIVIDIQNEERHTHHDIVTITGFMKTEQELIAHINRNK